LPILLIHFVLELEKPEEVVVYVLIGAIILNWVATVISSKKITNYPKAHIHQNSTPPTVKKLKNYLPY